MNLKSLKEVTSFISRGITPKYNKDGIVVINQRCIRNNSLSLTEARKTDSEQRKIPTEKYLKENDVLINSTGVGTLGRSAQIKNLSCDITVDSHVSIVRPDPDLLNPLFLGYAIQFKEPDIENLAEGSTGQTELSRVRLGEEIFIPIFSKKIQKKVVQILNNINEKIEVNSKINKNLENISQEIFKSWFIKFDPFLNEKFKKENNLKFPKSFHTGIFSDLIEETISGDWGKSEIEGNYIKEVYCVRGADIPDVKKGNKGKMPIRYILLKNYNKKKLKNNDIILEISGGSPTQSTGRAVAITQSFINRFDKPMICTNFCKVIRPIEHYNLFLYYYWNYFYDIEVMFSYENGTTGIKNFDVNGFINNEMIIIPPLPVVKKFNKIIMSFSKQIFNNALESEKLIKMRDSLLPKLMSGEIDVSNVKI